MTSPAGPLFFEDKCSRAKGRLMINEQRGEAAPFKQGLWVFGYGSLIWRPDFPFVERVLGRTHGVRRSFCVWSVFHRGSRASPGLVLGLEPGGVCEGVLFYVPADKARATLAYLKAREQVTSVYREMFRRVDLIDGSGRSVRALSFVINPRHPQYAGRMPLWRQAEIIKRSKGSSGFNLDYLTSTVHSLARLNIHDRSLARLQVLTRCQHKLDGNGGQRYACFRF